jgi:titin
MGNLTLSPGDRAALRFLYGAPAVPLTNIVTTTTDSGTGSLRAALYYVTDLPGSVVKFNIPTNDPGYSNGVFNIHLTGHLPILATNGMVIDGSTQPGFTSKPLIVVDGSQIIPETFTSNSGLLIYSASNQVKNISFQGFNWNGLTLEYADATNNTIAGCWLGLDSTGSNAAPNAHQGILFVRGASRNIIGGTNALARNVISGNREYGLWMSDTNTTGNVILGNYIGTDASGSFAVSNVLGGIAIFTNGVGHVIGGTNPDGSGRNVISGNGTAGIWLSGTSVSNVTVRGNFIGLNAAGTAAVPNTFVGVYVINGASGNTIGGNSTGARNVISGNKQYEIYISDPGTSNNSVRGNFIGTDVAGTNAIGTSGNGFGIGIWNGANGNTIGGAGAGAGNLISGHSGFSYGIAMGGVNGTVVQGNFVGTDLTGTNALANGFANVALWGGSTGNLVGGTGAGAGNVIAFAGDSGVVLYDPTTTNNAIRGNSIFSNGGLGIDFNNDGVTLNHTGFLAGPNDLQNFPVITNAFGYAASTIISGTLNSLANRTFSIDVYRNLSADTSGYGEGQFYVGNISVTTDGSGNATFAYTNSGGNYAGQYITATATSAGGDTSEFGLAVPCTNKPAPSAQFAGPLTWRTNGFVLTLTFQTNFTYRVQATTNLAASPIVWTDLTNINATNSSLVFTDRTATNYRLRFYRAVSP